MANPGKQSQPIPTALIVEDGDEYLEFFERHLRGYRLLQAHDAAGTWDKLRSFQVDVIVMDLRFDRIERDRLIGDVLDISRTRFGQDTDLSEAWSYMADNQGYFIIKELRSKGYDEPVLIIEQLSPRRAENLRRLYGHITVVPEFDPKLIHRALIDMLSTP